MRRGGSGRPGARNGRGFSVADSDGERVITYCVVPADLADALYETLREHFVDDPAVEVVVERRGGERRRGSRRKTSASETLEDERRVVRSPAGRRVGDRRVATVSALVLLQLPRRARRHAARLSFVQWVEPTEDSVRDRDADRLILRFQSGDDDAFDELYRRYFDFVYRYAVVALWDRHEAEDIVQKVFLKVFGALSGYEVRLDSPFRAWLFRITRNTVLDVLAARDRLRLEEPSRIDRRQEIATTSHVNPTAEMATRLGWLSDNDLAIFVMRLPADQRQALAMRYLFDMRTQEIADAMDRSPTAVRMLIHRGLRELEDRLCAIGRAPAATRRSPVLGRIRKARVLGARRFALVHPHASRHVSHRPTPWGRV